MEFLESRKAPNEEDPVGAVGRHSVLAGTSGSALSSESCLGHKSSCSNYQPQTALNIQRMLSKHALCTVSKLCPHRSCLRGTLSQTADEESPGALCGTGVSTVHSIRGSGTALEDLDGRVSLGYMGVGKTTVSSHQGGTELSWRLNTEIGPHGAGSLRCGWVFSTG